MLILCKGAIYAEKEFEVIEIEWSEYMEKDKDKYENVLYMLYGDSPIYGKDVLLYFGQTNDFERRFIEHENTDLERVHNKVYYIGKINGTNKENISGYLDITESLITVMTKPSYNSKNVKDLCEKAKTSSFMILNNGDYRDLPQEVSNIWW